ncbi:HAMP domain-containing histidine kinase [Eubacterium sp. MSJ-13]|uniref:sensor histidine kinase n=1 Tax=Eubacterium sp. MSJ-13 TaxID=2841513 RepID=UPI001C0F8160|nr:HAMP domain-containing sensor histidine kinase [Eubacterium sp. MSJ-13]MBU5478400.1 HAMP domain-containing histidine kinase [Eubacterium sp. MSJ-13]
MKDIKITKKNRNGHKKSLRVLFNIIQAVSLSVFLVMGMILTVATGKYGVGTSGVKAEIKNRIQAMNKKAAEYSKIVLNKDAYKDMECKYELGGLSNLQKKYIDNKDSNYMFTFKVDNLGKIDNNNGSAGKGYKVTTSGEMNYFQNRGNTSFMFDKKKLYNDAIEYFLNRTQYGKSKRKNMIFILKKIYPYEKMILDFYSYEGEMVCSVSFDGSYRDKMFKKLSGKKIGGIKVTDDNSLWVEAIFSMDLDSSGTSPFTGEFKSAMLETCDESELLRGNLRFAVHSVKQRNKRCYVYAVQYGKDTYSYKITGDIRRDLRSGDDLYYLCWYDANAKSVSFATYISGILLLISSIGIAVMARVSKNESGKLGFFYRIPMDVALFVAGIAVSIALTVLVNTDQDEIKNLIKYGFTNIITVCITAGSIAGVIFTVCYTSFCAQLKDSAVINNMFITKLIMFVVRAVKSLLSMVKTSVFVFVLYWAAGIIECILAVYGGSEVAFFTVIIAKIIGTIIIARVLRDVSRLHAGIKRMAAGDINGKIKTEDMLTLVKNEAECLNSIGEGMKKAVDAQIKSERMKTELITNVSHDIKTPVTAIISYVDLLKKEDLKNENAAGYVEVLDRQSERLKNLIYDLLDLSKASTGNVDVNMAELDLPVFVEQSLGEYIPKMEKRNLTPVVKFKMDDDKKNRLKIRADGRHLSRVFDNIFQNICKYAMENTRVYIDVELSEKKSENSKEFSDEVIISVKNMSEQSLNISGDELTERFVRGDKSRNTEGSGLGLSIAKSLMKLQDGNLDVIIDGDLFKVVITLNGMVSD